MAETYTITLPEIRAVTLTPETVDAGGKCTVSVSVGERTVLLEPVWPYSGQISSGQIELFGG